MKTMNARQDQSGYSLIEVIVSLGILTGVILAIASMFALAQSNVRSGRIMTEAVAIGQDMMEDMNKLSYNGLQAAIAGSTVLTTLNSFTANTKTAGVVITDAWQANIDTKLYKGFATIKLQPIGGVPKPATFASGEAIRVNVEVFWTELRRGQRSVQIEGVRF